MHLSLRLAASLLFLTPVVLSSQQLAAVPAPSVQPLGKMPYSPSLDVTSLDRGVDPCVNFYQFSCGGWVKKNPIPADQAKWSVYAKLANDNQQFLWGILQDDAKAANRTHAQQKVGDYFESCMNVEAIDATGLKPLQPALARINAVGTREQVVAELERCTRRPAAISSVREQIRMRWMLP